MCIRIPDDFCSQLIQLLIGLKCYISKNIACIRCVTVASGYQAQDISAHDARCILWSVAILTCARCIRVSIAIHISLWTLLAR